MPIEVPLKEKHTLKKEQKKSHLPVSGNSGNVGRRYRRSKRATMPPQGKGPTQPRPPAKVITPKAAKEEGT